MRFLRTPPGRAWEVAAVHRTAMAIEVNRRHQRRAVFMAIILFHVGPSVIITLRELTPGWSFDCIASVKWIALALLLVVQCSCSTLVTRRDLYSPEPG